MKKNLLYGHRFTLTVWGKLKFKIECQNNEVVLPIPKCDTDTVDGATKRAFQPHKFIYMTEHVAACIL